jgi:two-component system, chemotaxis family, CheB/CheR fusion protein
MCIMRFTKPVTRILNLIATDLGRPLSDISTNMDDSTLISDIDSLLKTHSTRERQAKTKDGMLYQVRIRPYRTIDEKLVAGAVVSFWVKG